MTNLPAGVGPGVRRSNPPASKAPVRRLWAAVTWVHKEEPGMHSVCVFCNRHKGPNVAGVDSQTRKIVPPVSPRRHKSGGQFRWDGSVLKGPRARWRATVIAL